MNLTRLFWKSLDCKTDLQIHQGGTSSSKTYTTLQRLYLIAKREKCLISVVSESMPHLKRGAIRDFQNILIGEGVWDDDSYNRTDKIYKVGKSQIEFFSADDPNKMRGGRRDYLFINECNNVSYDAFDQLYVRTKKQTTLDFNPVAPFWVHDKVMPNYKHDFIKSTYKDNDYLDKKIIEKIEAKKSIDPNWWRVYGLGEVGSLEGVIFDNWDVCDDMPGGVEFYGLDFGFTNDPTALIRVVKAHGNIYLDQLIYETGLTNLNISEKLKELGLTRESEITADSAEPKSIAELKHFGWNVKPAFKGADSINNGIDMMKRYRIFITKRSIDLIKEFRNYTWKVTANGETINKPVDDYNHGIDAVRYAVSKKLSRNSKAFTL